MHGVNTINGAQYSLLTAMETALSLALIVNQKLVQSSLMPTHDLVMNILIMLQIHALTKINMETLKKLFNFVNKVQPKPNVD